MNKAQIYSTKRVISLAIATALMPVFLFVFTGSSQAAAGINRTINFQGKVVNKTAGTNVANGSYNFTFKIYDAATSGTLIWTENYNSTNGNQLTVTDGIFRAALGSVCSFSGGSCQGNTNTAVNFNSDSLYLDITFNGETMGTRVQLTAVPYALNAEKVSGLSVTNNGGNTLNIAANKTLTVSNSLTFSGTDGVSLALGANNISFTTTGTTSLTLPTSGTVTALGNTTTGSGSTLVLATNPSFAGLTLASGNITLSNSETIDNTTNGAITFTNNTANTDTIRFSPGANGGSARINGIITTADLTTSDKTWTFPNVSGNVITSGDTGTVTNTMLANPSVTLNAGTNFGISGPGAMTLGSTYTIGSTSDNLRFNGLGLGVAAPTTAGQISAVAGANNITIFQLKRNTDTSPTGNFLDFQNAASSSVFNVSVAGAIGIGGAYGSAGDCLKSGGGVTSAMTFGSCGGGSALFTDSGTFTYLTSTTDDLVLGGSSVAAGSFFMDVSTGTLYLGTDGSLNGVLTLYSSGAGITDPTISVDSSGNLNLSAGQSGAYVKVGSGVGDIYINPGTYKVGLGTSTPTSQLHVTRPLSNGATGKALAIFDQIENQDIFTASKGGTPKFIIGQNGEIGLGLSGGIQNFGSSGDCLQSGGIGSIATWGSCGAGGGSNWRYNLGTLSPINDTVDVLFGANASASAKFKISPRGTTPTASISGKTSYAALVVNNSGVGDLLTASSGGQTRFVMSNNGSTVYQGDSITAIGNGAVGNNGSNAVSNMVGDSGSMIPNAGFESAITASVADGWFPSSTSSAMFLRETVNIAKGTASVKVLFTNSRAAIYSTCIPLSGAVGSYTLNYYVKGTAPLASVQGQLQGFTSKANCQSGTSPTVANAMVKAATTSWVRNGTSTTALASIGTTATWARVAFQFVCTSSCTNSTTYIDGVRLTESTTGQGLDYAENYPADPNNLANPGDVVSLSQVGGKTVVVPSTKYMDKNTIGIISTEPGLVLDDGKVPDPKVAVALAGRVPVKVSSKNGPIQIGDSLTSSSIPGVAIKAKDSGQVIGTAMEIWDDPDPAHTGTVVVFVKNSFANISQFDLNQFNADEVLTQMNALNSNSAEEYSTVSIDQLAANIQIISPRITVDELFAKRIVAGQIEGLDVVNDRLSALEKQVATLSANLNQSQRSTESATAEKENALMDRISKNLESATVSATAPSGTLSIGPLDDSGFTTLAGSLRVQGNGLFEGILTVLDNLTTNNFIVNGVSTFFSDAIFKGNVNFGKAPIFASDSGGFATIVKGTDRVSIRFDNEFESDPLINAQVSFDEKKDDQGRVQNTSELEQAFFGLGYKYIVVNRSKKGFTIVLNKKAGDDVNFIWTAVQIKDAKTVQSRLSY